MQYGGLCRGVNDSTWTTCSWYIDNAVNFVKFHSDASDTAEFTGTIKVQGQFQYEV